MHATYVCVISCQLLGGERERGHILERLHMLSITSFRSTLDDCTTTSCYRFSIPQPADSAARRYTRYQLLQLGRRLHYAEDDRQKNQMLRDRILGKGRNVNPHIHVCYMRMNDYQSDSVIQLPIRGTSMSAWKHSGILYRYCVMLVAFTSSITLRYVFSAPICRLGAQLSTGPVCTRQQVPGRGAVSTLQIGGAHRGCLIPSDSDKTCA